jgi:hypothetical protein
MASVIAIPVHIRPLSITLLSNHRKPTTANQSPRQTTDLPILLRHGGFILL